RPRAPADRRGGGQPVGQVRPAARPPRLRRGEKRWPAASGTCWSIAPGCCWRGWGRRRGAATRAGPGAPRGAAQRGRPAARRVGGEWGEGGVVAGARRFWGWAVELRKRPQGAKGFVVIPRRWVVERTFAWLMRYRRLWRDSEELTSVSETMITVAMIHLMARRVFRE